MHLKHQQLNQMKILKHLLLLSLLVVGCFILIIWLGLIFLTMLYQDQSRKANRYTTQQPEPLVVKPHVPTHTTFDKQAYLKSSQWQALRKFVLKRDAYTCQSCRISGISLEVHHITYIRLGNEYTSDLVSVCRDCHQAIHNKYGYAYSNVYPISS